MEHTLIINLHRRRITQKANLPCEHWKLLTPIWLWKRINRYHILQRGNNNNLRLLQCSYNHIPYLLVEVLQSQHLIIDAKSSYLDKLMIGWEKRSKHYQNIGW